MRTDVAWRDHVGRPCRHADEDSLWRHELLDFLDVPEAVLQAEHVRLLADQGPDACECRRRMGRLREDDEQVGCGGRRFGPKSGEAGDTSVASIRFQTKTTRADGLEMSVVHVDQRDRNAALGNEATEQRPHGACAQNRDSHGGRAQNG